MTLTGQTVLLHVESLERFAMFSGFNPLFHHKGSTCSVDHADGISSTMVNRLPLLSSLLGLTSLCLSGVTAFTSNPSSPSRRQARSLLASLPRILLCDVPVNLVSDLNSEFNNRAELHPVQGWTDEEVQDDLCSQDYEAVIVRSANTISGDMIESIISSSEEAPGLRVIGRAGVGLDNIDCDAAKQANIPVVTAAGANAIAVAEHAFALLFALARRIKPAVNSVAGGKWMKPNLVGLGVRGKILGVIGFGAIGTEIATIGSALGMKILIAPPTEENSDDSRKQQRQSKTEIIPNAKESSSLTALLQDSDFVSVQLPLTETTTNFIGRDELETMKPSAMLISVGRGGVIDEDALLESLLDDKGKGSIAGAALDVFVNEGPGLKDDETLMQLASLDSTIITPHLGGHTEEAQADVWSCVITNVLDVLDRK